MSKELKDSGSLKGAAGGAMAGGMFGPVGVLVGAAIGAVAGALVDTVKELDEEDSKYSNTGYDYPPDNNIEW